MNITCCLIDDQPAVMELIATFINNTPGYELVARETDSVKALNKFNSGEIIADLTFLDIEMPGLNGIELASRINKMTNIIFTTGHRQFGPESYELGAIGYIVKPLSYDKFAATLDNAKKRMKEFGRAITAPDNFMFIPGNGKGEKIRLDFSDIVYIKASSNYILIYTPAKKDPYMTYLSLSDIAQKLPVQFFLRVHKSYIVNLRKILRISSDTIYLPEENEIPIGQTYRANVVARIR